MTAPTPDTPGARTPDTPATTEAPLPPDQVARLAQAVLDEVATAVVGMTEPLRIALAAILAGGHVLFEDVPGLGKTLAARSLATTLGLEFRRIQCTPDLLPSDITGSAVWDPQTATFRFRPGPVFAGLLLADEINRTAPKTQSALLEAMAERQVTVDGTTYPMARPFHVVATSNPVEYEGTYPLPEAQLDRFMVRVSLGYPSPADEAEMLADHAASDRVLELEPVTDVAMVRAAQAGAAELHASEEVRRYVVAVCTATRDDPRVEQGASPRAGLMLFRAAKAHAALEGRDHVLPDDVQALAPSVLGHRLMIAPDALGGGGAEAVVADALASVPAL